jgi:hypothetical protein
MAIHLHDMRLLTLSHAASPAMRVICMRATSHVFTITSGRTQRGNLSVHMGRMENCSCGLALEDLTGQAYNEQAFRHFLAIERKRATRASRSFLLLLVSLRKEPGANVVINAKAASRLFSGLAGCVREVDFIGWYRQERVAGAVLTQGAATPAAAAVQGITDRVTGVLGQHLSASEAQRLQVRVLQLSRRPK